MKIHNLSQQATEAFKMGRPDVGKGESDDFAKQLMDVMKEVNDAQNTSSKKQTELMTGQPVEIQDVMIAMERASTAMQLTLAVRNKLLDAYQEVMRTQV